MTKEKEKETEKEAESDSHLGKEDWKRIKRMIRDGSKEEKAETGSQGKQEHSENHTHWDAEELIGSAKKAGCPECDKQLKILKELLTKDIWSERKGHSLECVECGLPVGEKEETCPACGGKTAKPRD